MNVEFVIEQLRDIVEEANISCDKNIYLCLDFDQLFAYLYDEERVFVNLSLFETIDDISCFKESLNEYIEELND